MKQVFVTTAFAIASAALVFGCASETTGPSSETGSVGVNLLVGDNDVTAVNFEVTCSDSTVCPLNGQFNVIDRGPNEPPIWATIMDLPVGDPDPIVYTINLTALDDQQVVLCTGSADFTVVANETVKVDLVLTCGGDGEELLGSVDIDATFEIIDGNRCPRLHFLNAVPIDVPAEGSEVTVLVSDADDDPLTTLLTTTGGGSFANPAARSTTYTCDGASGGQTISVTVSDGTAACDKSKSFDVVCPGVNLCEDVTCDDTCNQCTVGICTNQSAPECEETNVDNDTPCIAGIPGWVTEFCTPPDFSGPCEKTDTMANTGTSSARIFNDSPGTPSVLKQANKGKGIVQPGDTVTVSFWAKGTGVNGGVAFAEFFTELEGGGTSNSILLGNAPLSLLPDQFQFFSFEVTVGDPAGGGVTVQFNAATGAIEGSTSKLFVDDVSIALESGVDVADNGGVEGGTVNSTCQDGVCEPSAECTVETVVEDCPPTNNECIDPVCNAGTCETSNNSNACEGGTGTCSGGECVPDAEVVYFQDFNQLDIGGEFIGDGWVFFVNAFAPIPYGYGGAAPNGPQICSLVDDQGGAEQAPQQLNVYSDYNNADHGNGVLIETNVFQEPFGFNNRIPQSELGNTYVFSFQAKGGNINSPAERRCDPMDTEYTPNPPCDSTANGFIKTLNPDAGFSESSADRVDTTMLPDTWGDFTLSLEITQDVIGHILQYGFQTNATDFEPSGNYYDNVLLTK